MAACLLHVTCYENTSLYFCFIIPLSLSNVPFAREISMGIPNEAQWYHLLGAVILWGSYDACRCLVRERRRLYNHPYDILDSAVLIPTNPTEQSLLYQHFSSPPFEQFSYFTKLPTEIRNYIWALACSQPRTIEMRLVKKRRSSTRDLYTISSIPPILHVNYEARHEALKHYELSLAPPHLQALGAGTYVNFSYDTVYLGFRSSFISKTVGVDPFFAPGLEKIKLLALGRLLWPGLRQLDWRVFKSLEEICLTKQNKTQRRFDLGRASTLIKGEAGLLQLETVGLEVHEKRILQNFEMELSQGKLTYEGKFPVLRLGTFEKGKGDRFYFQNGSTWWPF